MVVDPRREAVLEAVERQSVVDGRFSHIKRIDPVGGGGFFSFLFTADDSVSRRRVAIKVLDTLGRRDAYRESCFEREPLMLAQLAHRHDVVQLIADRAEMTTAVSVNGGPPFVLAFPYYVMELASTSLDALILRNKWTPVKRLEAFREICRAVQWLHAHGIAHRDIKPGNILLCRSAAKLGDFGTARVLTETPLLPTYFGKPPGDLRYTPPELLAGIADDDPALFKAADVFALGCTLFELVTGTPLGLLVYETGFAHAFIGMMAVVPPADRRRVFDGVVSSVADGRPIPGLTAAGTDLPKSCRPYVEDLVRDMASLDYRRRPTDFASVFRRLEISLVVLRNEYRDRRRQATRLSRRRLTLAARTGQGMIT